MMSLCPLAISPTPGRLPLVNAKSQSGPNHLSPPNSARHRLGCPGTSLPIACASPKTHPAGATGKKRGGREGLESGQAPGLPCRTSWARWGVGSEVPVSLEAPRSSSAVNPGWSLDSACLTSPTEAGVRNHSCETPPWDLPIQSLFAAFPGHRQWPDPWCPRGPCLSEQDCPLETSHFIESQTKAQRGDDMPRATQEGGGRASLHHTL